MKLYIVQHGAAVSKEENPQRPLSEQGVFDVGRLAQTLADKKVTPTRIIHSGKERAQQTAQIIADALSLGDRLQQQDGLAPSDDPVAFVSSLDQSGGDILLASHMPFVDRLSKYLLGENGLKGFEFEPGRLVCIQLDGPRVELYWTSD